MKRRRSSKATEAGRGVVIGWMVVMAVLTVLCFSIGDYLVSGQASDIADETVVTIADVPQEKDYILDIPLSCELQEELHNACVEFGVDYYIMVALIERETNFRNVQGDNGRSYGYCQIQPRWWYGLMCEIGATDLNVPKDNFRTACAIMSGLTKTYNSTEGALVAYNRGSYKGKSTSYSREIIANAERYRA